MTRFFQCAVIILALMGQVMGTTGSGGSVPHMDTPPLLPSEEDSAQSPPFLPGIKSLRNFEVPKKEGDELFHEMKKIWEEGKKLSFFEAPLYYLSIGGIFYSLAMFLFCSVALEEDHHSKPLLTFPEAFKFFLLPYSVLMVVSLVTHRLAKQWEGGKKAQKIDGMLKNLMNTYRESPYAPSLKEFKSYIKLRRKNFFDDTSLLELDHKVSLLLEKIKEN